MNLKTEHLLLLFLFIFCYFSNICFGQSELSVADSRLKKNIVGLHGGLSSVLKMRGVTYEWKTKSYPQFQHKDGKEIGFVAQELEEIEPLLVDLTSEGFKTIEYERVTVVLVEAVKEQQQMINHLKKQLSTMQLELNALKMQKK
ncbi:MAG: tail fiber domain-containing protein [Cytophagales bacterium]|nr:MAG: tail fiber domain-containing protein [Cytophagales bacterium]